MLPSILITKYKLVATRNSVLTIVNATIEPSIEEQLFLSNLKKSYKCKSNIELLGRLQTHPTSIVIAQAALESGWGTSRFALEGNAIFGQWTWNGIGMAPLDKDKNENHKILKFPLLRASVKAYIDNLNTHRGYKSFRVKRAELRKQNKKLSGIELIHELENYAQTGKEYTKILEKIIEQNDLGELEAVTIDDFKENKQLKL
jgi:Bax protein